MDKIKTDVSCVEEGCEKKLYMNVHGKAPAAFECEVTTTVDEDGNKVFDYTLVRTDESIPSPVPERECYCIIHGLQGCK